MISGFGYADFGDRQSLVDALAMNDNFLKNRKIKIDISTNSSGPDRGGQRGGFGDRMGKNERSLYWKLGRFFDLASILDSIL